MDKVVQTLTILTDASRQVTFRTHFGGSAQLWHGGASTCVESALECVVQMDKDKRFVDLWMRCAPSELEQVLVVAKKVS